MCVVDWYLLLGEFNPQKAVSCRLIPTKSLLPRKWLPLSSEVSLSLSTYIYIYIYICMCIYLYIYI
jgi:hypothetical protein